MAKNVQWRGKAVYTGIWKTPVEGPVMVRRINIDGDGQGDLAGHGGEQRAVMVYQTESYDFWKSYLNRDDLAPGHFGENFTVTGLADAEVCIGDR
jgi:MOSC domain-containing protein YiiM